MNVEDLEEGWIIEDSEAGEAVKDSHLQER